MQRFFLAAALAALFFPAVSSGEVVIDDFNAPPTELEDRTTGDGGVSVETIAPSSIFNSRFLSLEKTLQGGGFPNAAVTANFGGGLFTFGEPNNASGRFTLGYDGTVDTMFAPNTADNNFNFMGDGETGFEIFADSDLGVSLMLSVFNDGVASMTSFFVTGSGSSTALQRFFIPFTAFSGADFSAVDAFSLSYNSDGATGDDLAIGRIAAVGPDFIGAPVPEPTSIALAGLLGAGLFGGAARRRRKAAAV